MKDYYTRFLLKLIMALLPVNVFGQDIFHIIDAETGEALSGACMYVTEGKGAWTNDEGNAKLTISDNEQVKITYIGYKTLTLKKSELTSTIKLTPLSKTLSEVSIESDERLLEQLAKKLNKESNANRKYRVPFFSRVTMQTKETCEMVESFLEAGSAGNIHTLKLYSGQYYNISISGIGASNLRTTNIHNIFLLGPNTENDLFWKGYEGPLHQGVTSAWLKRNYHISSEIYMNEEGDGLRCITFTPKFKNAKTIGGKMYLKSSSRELVYFEGKIDTDVVTYRNNLPIQSHPTIDFVINYTNRNGFCEVDNMTFSFESDGVKCRSMMINMDKYGIKDELTWPVEIGKNFVTAIDDVGYNPHMDKYLSIMTRTKVEDAITQGKFYAMNDSETSSDENTDTNSHTSKWRNALPQEKVYLHLDNTGYFKGEKIWFKAYVVRTDTEKRGNISNILYVDLVDPNGNIIKHQKIYVTHGIGAGNITLDNAVMPTGFYELRAYTRYMTNWNINSCFSRIIPIFKEPQKEGDYTPRLDKQTELLTQETTKEEKHAFYPEGGCLVKGLPARVAYNIKGKRGVVDIPASRENNSVDIEIDGSTHTYSLPQSLDEGISLRVNALRDDSLVIDLWATPQMFDKELGYALIHSGKIITSSSFNTQAHQRFAINKDILPDGVSQVTVFAPEGGALADRFIFRCPKYTDTLQIKSTTTEILPCGKISMSIKSTPYTSLSFSVLDANNTINGKRGDIKTWMLLGSDIKGYIANPEYYFESDDEEHRKAADLLMMIQGWRRYDWNVMNGHNKMMNLKPYESNLTIDGRIKAKKGTNANVSGVTITATLHGGEESFGVSTVTDSIGNYALALPDLQGEWAMSLSASQNGISDNYIITINRDFSPTPRQPEGFEIKELPIDNLGTHHWDIMETNANVWKKFLDARGETLNEITIKKKKLDNYNWEGFKSERNAQTNSTIFYDCEKAIEEYLDRGEEPPYLIDWLSTKDKMFKGSVPTDKAMWAAIGDTISMAREDHVFLPGMIIDTGDFFYLDNIFNENIYSNYENFAPNYWIPVWRDGLEINGRPVVWVVNNLFCTITNLNLRSNISAYDSYDSEGGLPIRDMLVRKNVQTAKTTGRLTRQTAELPEMLEDVKSLYIADDPNLVYQITTSSDFESKKPYIIYCFTNHDKVKNKVKGIRYTTFQGFSPVEVFRTENYDVMPPMDDFRRTIYWNPNIWTDEQGNASVEFWNNSTCTDMIISAEGITDDGKFVVGR